MEHRYAGVVLMLSAMGLFALSDVFAKQLAASIPVNVIVWFRYAVLGVALSVGLCRGAKLSRSKRSGLQWGRSIGILSSALLFNLGLAHLPVADATALAFSSPLFQLLLTVTLLQERVGWERWMVAILGFVGVVIVAAPDPEGMRLAVVFPLLASVGWASAMVITRRVAHEDSGFTTQIYSCVIGLGLLSVSLLWSFVWPSIEQLLLLLMLGACWSLAQWLVVVAYSHSSPSVIAPVAYSQLLWAGVLAWLFFGQLPAERTAWGAAIILVAGAASGLLRR